MAALIEAAESLIQILEEGGARQNPVIDFVVEGMRKALQKGYAEFEQQIKLTFASRFDPPKSRRLAKKFWKVNRLRIAELVLTERLG